MNKAKTAIDPEMAEFEAALMRSVDQTTRGEGRVTTPEEIQARLQSKLDKSHHKITQNPW